MADNFNLSKFIRNNPLLNESIGGYRDIKPMKEGSDEDLFIKVIPGILKNVNVYDMKRAFDKGEFDSALKSFKDTGEVSQEDMAISILHDYFAKKIGGSKPMEEAEGPDSMIFGKGWQYDDADEMDSDENETYGRAFGLAGQQLKSAIDALRQADYNDEDIKNFLMTGIDMYDQAFDGYDDLEEAKSINEKEASVEDVVIAMDKAVAFAKKLAQRIANKKGGSLTQNDFFRLIDNFGYKAKDFGPFKRLNRSDDLEEAEGLNEEEYMVNFGTNTQDFKLDRDRDGYVLKSLKPGVVPGSARQEDTIPVTVDKNGYLSTTDRRVKGISPKSNKNPFSDPGYMNRD
jgi:hypothetical protein